MYCIRFYLIMVYLLEAEDGQLKTKGKKNAIVNFFDFSQPAQGELNTIKTNISNLQPGLNSKVSTSDLDGLISQ